MHKIFKKSVLFLLALVTVLGLLPVHHADAAAMKQGSKGTTVKQLQQNLIGLGYLDGTADGSYGSKTRKAVEAFQADFGLKADGTAGEATQTAIYNAVVRLQVELKNAGYAPGTADGHFGSKTRAALEKFQRDEELEVTGEMNKATWSAMDRSSMGIRGGAAARTAEQIKRMQQALIGLGYLNDKADGVYGSKTREAVRQYQKAYGLTADGSAGSKTMTSLKNTVTALQSDLARKGYYTGKIDSSFGSGTQAAVKAYQKKNGLNQTGIAGASTMKKLYGYALGAEVTAEKWKIWIDSLYQDTDYSKFWYNDRTMSKTVKTSGCAGVSTAMALNALLDTDLYTGQNVMQWFADHGYYKGSGTYHTGVERYPEVQGLKTTLTSKGSQLVKYLKKGAVAVVLIKDKTGEELFTYHESKGHYILVSGYQVKNDVEQVYVNNPLSWKESRWFDLKDLMANAIIRSDFDPIVIIYK